MAKRNHSCNFNNINRVRLSDIFLHYLMKEFIISDNFKRKEIERLQ